HGIAVEIGGKTGHPFGLGGGARLPQPVQLRRGVQLGAEPAGKPRRGVSPDQEGQYHRSDPTGSDHSRAGAGPIATPHGILPTGTVAITASLSVSTTLTSLEGPLAVYSFFPSRVRASPQGRWPTLTEPVIRLVAGSMTSTVPPLPVATYTLLPSGEKRTPMGLASGGSL